MYILHDSSVGFLFSRIYRRILRKSETRPRADMVTRACPRKKVKEASDIFVRSPLDGGVGHVLVLVFSATRRHLALRAAWVIERAGRHVVFFSKFQSVKPSYTV